MENKVQEPTHSFSNGVNSTFFHASFLFQQVKKAENPNSRIPKELEKNPRFNGPN